MTMSIATNSAVKKYILIFLALALNFGLHAQAKKVAAKAVTPAKQTPETKPAPAEADEEIPGHLFGWGGYNISTSKYWDEFADLSTVTTTKGGLAAGGELTLGTDFIQAGIGVSYLPIGTIEIANISGSVKIVALPLEAVANVFVFRGLYLGARGGYTLNIGASLLTNASHRISGGVSYGGQVGYIYAWGVIGVNVGAIVSIWNTSSLSGGVTTAATFINIVPRLGVDFKF